ncbi:MAG: PilW family protein [Thermoanaerobaculia bacterium]|nr:PilW family protein [Thermoanaerobaculia bacterium]
MDALPLDPRNRCRHLALGRVSRGYSLIELLVALAMMVVVLIAALVLLDTTNRATRTQVSRADVQHSLRLAQGEIAGKVRMAGRGGLLAATTSRPWPDGVALEVDNNVEDDRTLFPSDLNSPKIKEGTDVLVVRGSFDLPLYYLNPLDSSRFQFDPARGVGSVIVPRRTPNGGFVQDLELLAELRSDAREAEAIVVVSPFDDDVYGVALIDWSASRFDPGSDTFRLGFTFEDDPAAIDPRNPDNVLHAASALSSGGAFPRELFRAGFKTLGILEEHRYFVRDPSDESGASLGSQPKLSVVRTLLNRDEYWHENPARPYSEPWEDVVDGISDLQIALGFADPESGEVTETTDGADDLWFLNHPAESVPEGDLTLVRITTLARSAAPDRNSEAKVLLRLEDRSYTDEDINSPVERKYRRFFLPTVVSLRNL